jgi:hypothetical protein
MALWLMAIALFFGFALGWAARRDDGRRYVQSNKRHYRGRLDALQAELDDAEAELDRAGQVHYQAAAPPVQQTVVHVHMPAYPAAPAPQYLEVLPASQLELNGRVA